MGFTLIALPPFLLHFHHKRACPASPMSTVTHQGCTWEPQFLYIIPLANFTLAGFICLSLNVTTPSFYKNKCFECPPCKHFPALSPSAERFSFAELETNEPKPWTAEASKRLFAINNINFNYEVGGNVFLKEEIILAIFPLIYLEAGQTMSTLFLRVETQITQLGAFLQISTQESLPIIALCWPKVRQTEEIWNCLLTWQHMWLHCHFAAVLSHLQSETRILQVCKCNCRTLAAGLRTRNRL